MEQRKHKQNNVKWISRAQVLYNKKTGQVAISDLTAEGDSPKLMLVNAVPEWLNPETFTRDTVTVAVDLDSSELTQVKPVNGTFKVRFTGFTAREGEAPTIKATKDNFGNELMKFYAKLNILAEGWGDGTEFSEVIVPLEYNRIQRDVQNDTAYVWGSSKGADLLTSFLTTLGYDRENTLTYRQGETNILPRIEKFGKDKVMNLTFAKGWANNFSPNYDTVANDDATWESETSEEEDALGAFS